MRYARDLLSLRIFLKHKICCFSMSRLILALILILQPVVSGISTAAVSLPTGAHLKDVSYSDQLLRIQLDKKVTYRIFSLSKPPRLVVELEKTIHSKRPYEKEVNNDPLLKKIRSAQFKSSPEMVTRVVLDMFQLASYKSYQQGNLITLYFGNTAKDASFPQESSGLRQGGNDIESREQVSDYSKQTGPVHKSPLPRMLSGETSASLEATAAEKSAGSKKKSSKKRAKDLLASLPKTPVTIDFDDADIRDVLRVLSEMSEINMIHASDMRGFVTIHLKQVPFDEAFNTILTMQGLVAQQMGDNILRILTPEGLNSDRARAVVTYKTYTLNYAHASDIVTHLTAVRISPNSKVTVDERSNSIIVTDTPEGLAGAERLIAELDRKPQQVLIEAKIVEVILKDNLDLGIQWEHANEKTMRNGSQRFTGILAAETGDSELEGVGISTYDPQRDVSYGAATPLGRGTGVALPGNRPEAAITFGFISNSDILTMTINALAEKGLTKILSAPKIITINNQQASIQAGSRLPFSSVTIASSGVATQTITFVDVGIMLTVTPVINADKRIRLKLKPEVSLPGEIGPAGPEIFTRNAETEVIIRDGETLVVGGLIDENMLESAEKVPLLGDIPVLGAFFRKTTDSKRRSELLVFVTPRIVLD